MLGAVQFADIWSWIVPLVIVVIYLLNHLLAGNKAQGQKPAQQRRRPPQGERPLAQQPGQRPQQQAGQDPLQSEIEQFLQRANERRKEKARRSTPPQQRAKPAPPPRQLVPVEEPVDVEPLERDFDSVATSVEKHFSSSRQFESRAEHLADDVSQADEQMQRHLHQAFDHRLGTLGSSQPSDVHATEPSPNVDAPASTAKAVAGLLANRQNIKQAVLLKEILERPVDRW